MSATADFGGAALLEDKRLGVRQEIETVTLTVGRDDRGRATAHLKDISRTGARFLSAGFFPCGGIVTLYPPEGAALEPVQARVMRQRYVEAASGNHFEYGVRVEGNNPARHEWFLVLRQGLAAPR